VSTELGAASPWAWHPHLFVWAPVAVVGAGVPLVRRRLVRSGDHASSWPTVRVRRFVGALIVTVVALGWPLGDLAAHWSLSALVLQRCLLVLAVASLLLGGVPDDVIRWVTRPAAVDTLLLRILRPPVAVIVVTVVLVGSMAPPLVAAQSHSALVRGAVSLAVVCAGIVLWLPVIGRVPGIARPRPMIRAVYLVAQAVVPVFLSFVFILAPRPLFPTLSHAGSAIGLSPLGDQQVAGFVSKLSFLFTLLAVAGAVLARAPDSDDDLGPEDPLVWADIERHFERADRRGGSAPEPLAAPGTGDVGAGPATGIGDVGTGPAAPAGPDGSAAAPEDAERGRDVDPGAE